MLLYGIEEFQFTQPIKQTDVVPTPLFNQARGYTLLAIPHGSDFMIKDRPATGFLFSK